MDRYRCGNSFHVIQTSMKHQAIFFGALGLFGYALFSAQPGGMNSVSGKPGAQASAASAAGLANADETVLERDGSGQFHLTAQVDGEDTQFLVDTGADMVALTVEEAERLGFPVDPEGFEPMTQTASGTGYGTVVRLGSIEVAGEEFHDVEAVVLDGLSVNLLGQSVLSRLGQVSLEGDRMVIRR